MEKVDQVTQQLQVGKHYWVPCLRIKPGMEPCRFQPNEWVPVIGTLHSDPLINADFPHHHIDWRFVHPKRIYTRSFIEARQSAVIGDTDVISFGSTRMRGQSPHHHHYLDSDVCYKRRKCYRVFLISVLRRGYRDPSPTHLIRVLEKQHAGCKATCDRCPHQGLPLNGLPVEHDGAVTCLGHGLRWHHETGALIPLEASYAE